MKKLLKITVVATLMKSALFTNHERYRSQTMIAQIETLNEDCVNILRPYLLYFPKNKPSQSVMVGRGRFIVLYDSASPEIVIKMYLNCFPFFKGFRAV